MVHEPKNDRDQRHPIKLKDKREGYWYVTDDGIFVVWVEDAIYRSDTLKGALSQVKRKSVKVHVPFCKVKRDPRRDGQYGRIDYVATGVNNANGNIMARQMNLDGTPGRVDQMDGHDYESKAMFPTITEAEVARLSRLKEIRDKAEEQIRAIEGRHSMFLRSEVDGAMTRALGKENES